MILFILGFYLGMNTVTLIMYYRLGYREETLIQDLITLLLIGSIIYIFYKG